MHTACDATDGEDVAKCCVEFKRSRDVQGQHSHVLENRHGTWFHSLKLFLSGNIPCYSRDVHSLSIY